MSGMLHAAGVRQRVRLAALVQLELAATQPVLTKACWVASAPAKVVESPPTKAASVLAPESE